ncbi:MAG: carboxypeptidase-like regulatory domain-containing protein, partial [Gramella sp.]|nr:carboxypeptidase-like regulatory domain-containing protein [Christiangramia sp.]
MTIIVKQTKNLAIMKQFSLSYFKVVLFLLFPSMLLSQEVLEGRTINDDTGAIVPFVNVIEKGTSNGTTSDADGNFTITVQSLPTTLVFSYLGFVTQELNVTENSPLTIRFQESTAALEEVV